MAAMVKGNDTCNLPEWGLVPTNDSTTKITDLVVAGSNVPFGIFAFLSNFAIIVIALKTPSFQRSSNILLCSLATSDCLVGLVAQPLFFTWWMHIQRAQDYSCLYLQQLTLAAWIARVFPAGLSFANLTVISLDRCYALCRPFAYIVQRSQKEVTHFIFPGPFSSTAEENNRNSNHQNSYLSPRLRGIKQRNRKRFRDEKVISTVFFLSF